MLIIMKKTNNEKFFVEMFDTNSQVSTEEWEFDTKRKARHFFEYCKNQYMEPRDKKHIEWILSKIDSDGDYWQLDNFTYA